MPMQITFDNFYKVRIGFSIVAIIIVTMSIFFTNRLVKEMADEERHRIELWADATKMIVTNASSGMDLSFALKVIEGNHSIPVMIADDCDEVISFRNFHIRQSEDTLQYLQEKLQALKNSQEPIVLEIEDGYNQYIYYDDSVLLKQLSLYPYIQFGLIVGFFSILFFFFSSAKRSEQNRLWVGLSKETAHQLGTPISSLMAWLEIIKEGVMPKDMVPEMEKDVKRLQVIAERFSKIGSNPELQPTLLQPVLDNTLAYMQKRTSQRIVISADYKTNREIYVNLNPPLFEWVVENLCKNAVDAISKEGRITATVTVDNGTISIDLTDTGKGIAKSNFSAVFNPGFTTKKRGWGLGLSLAKRIIEEYHHGKIFVKKSEVGKGTTFRIQLKEVKYV